MNNYEYIIASLPLLSQDGKEAPDTDAILSEIKEQLSAKDLSILDLLLDSYDPEKLDAAFYRKALKERNKFVRSFFALDLGVRNTKVEYLNSTLGRPEGQDIVVLNPEGEEEEFEQKAEVEALLRTDDILGRERALDDFYWKAVDSLTVLDYFDLDKILAFVVKLKMVERWLRLDEATGRELFRKLVKEIKENTKI
ncbi:MAG: DUF2764 domain-containing protein [Bacteroidales bacterium]|nr:DUF2764 domain-containing protein [Bacteroidales bacterium]